MLIHNCKGNGIKQTIKNLKGYRYAHSLTFLVCDSNLLFSPNAWRDNLPAIEWKNVERCGGVCIAKSELPSRNIYILSWTKNEFISSSSTDAHKIVSMTENTIDRSSKGTKKQSALLHWHCSSESFFEKHLKYGDGAIADSVVQTAALGKNVDWAVKRNNKMKLREKIRYSRIGHCQKRGWFLFADISCFS